MTHTFLTVVYCGCDGDDKLKLTKFDDVVFELLIVFMKCKFCLGPRKVLMFKCIIHCNVYWCYLQICFVCFLRNITDLFIVNYFSIYK